jgi:hypothetical protein
MVERAAVADVDPGELAQRDRPDREVVGRARIELGPAVGDGRRCSLDLGREEQACQA